MFALSARAKAMENIYVRDQELGFILEARRNRLVGLWAAAVMGKDDASSYAVDVVSSAMDHNTGHEVFDRIRADFNAANIAISDDEIHDRMRDLLQSVARDMR